MNKNREFDNQDAAVSALFSLLEVPDHISGFFDDLRVRLEAETVQLVKAERTITRQNRNPFWRITMNMKRSTLITGAAVLLAMVTSATALAEYQSDGHTVYVPNGTTVTLTSSEVSPGDTIVCTESDAGAEVPSVGEGVGSSGGIRISTGADGKVTVVCAPTPPSSGSSTGSGVSGQG
jgi:hypothetical protein